MYREKGFAYHLSHHIDLGATLLKFKNLKEIIYKDRFYSDNFTDIYDRYSQNNSFNNKIALFNKLSNIELEFEYSRFTFTHTAITAHNLYYIYENHMLFINWNVEQYIKENITHLKVMNLDEKQVNFINNLPCYIECLHLSCVNYECLKNITNLPITLTSLSITIITNDNFLDVDLSYLKIPFACEFEQNYIVY